ncbi:MAG: PDZ domain-containing protein [candidate division KSB1 bacterium]|nr:PDZ domain-containing protein [candidate division KSB1 bacterium]MDZ7368834.1 PDZ domain-containing protein [candidate division KSB1 bacterium]MDZ7407410.1 PDZ domain-containing protein [candidate division KSB1 bacterium]
MLKSKNAGGWVLALVALALFGGLILRRLASDDLAPPENQISAGMAMSGNQRAAAMDLSAAFETITAQYLPVVVTVEKNGSGILVSSDGYILTTWQNLPATDSVHVTLHKGRRFAGWIAGSDPLTNLALVKINAKGLPYAKFGDSDRLRLGQWVMAIGQAPPTVTAAIINSKGRSKVALPQVDDLIHLDTPSDRINSGSALVSLEGELVGFSTAAGSRSGLAIPANLARKVMQSLMKDGKVTRGYIGAAAQDIDHNLARALRLNSTTGALLVEVAANSPAATAGLRHGDVVLQFANVPIATANDFENAVAAQTPDKNVQAVVWRDTSKVICEVRLEARPDVAPDASPRSPAHKPQNKIGVQVQNLPPDMLRLYNSGVMISYVDPHSPVASQLAAGDVIQEVNRQTIRDRRDFSVAWQGLQAGEVALVLIRRGEKKFFSGVEVQE